MSLWAQLVSDSSDVVFLDFEKQSEMTNWQPQIDYAAPEVLAGKPYGGKEQDVWALGILLYTIIYKENPFYSIDEIMDRDLRIPFIMSEESIDLIRCMLDRDVSQRYDITKVIEHPWLAAGDQE